MAHQHVRIWGLEESRSCRKLTEQKSRGYKYAESQLRVCGFNIVVIDRADGCCNIVAAVKTALNSVVPRLENMTKSSWRKGKALVYQYYRTYCRISKMEECLTLGFLTY